MLSIAVIEISLSVDKLPLGTYIFALLSESESCLPMRNLFLTESIGFSLIEESFFVDIVSITTVIELILLLIYYLCYLHKSLQIIVKDKLICITMFFSLYSHYFIR